MTNPEQSSELSLSNISELLSSVARKGKELEVEARRRLHQEQDVEGYREAMRQRTHLIKELPATIASYKEKGGIVPEEAQQFAETYSAHANQVLAEDNTIGMGTLLIPMGSRGDPDDLERLAAQLQPPTETISTL
jgi:hypothetical protein